MNRCSGQVASGTAAGTTAPGGLAALFSIRSAAYRVGDGHVTKTTFAIPWWVHLGVLGWFVVYGGLPIWILASGIAWADTQLILIGVGWGALFSLASLHTSSVIFRSAARVTVDGDGIKGKPLLGKRTTLCWDEIGEIRDLTVQPRPQRPVEQLLLVTADGHRKIAVGDSLRGFDELVAVIERQTPNARRTRDDRPSWKREVSFYRW